MKSRKTLKIIDLFAGAGGLTLGFTRLSRGNFETVWANDFDSYSVQTYNHNFGPHCVLGDINSVLSDKMIDIPDADIVIGGPPCQGFSLLNKNRALDPRKALWKPFLKIVELSGASVFVMENVTELLRSAEFEEICKAAKRLGFRIASAKLCAADYGVPQTRHRAFIVGCKFADPSEYFPPQRTHYNPRNGDITTGEYIKNPKEWTTVRDAIGDLPAPKGTEISNVNGPLNIHFGRKPNPISLSRYKAIPKEGMNRFDLQRNAPNLTPACWIKKKSGGTDLFGRLWWDRPAVTMRTEFFKPEKGRYLHPKQHRPITHREAARFQSFPDSFVFKGSKIEIAKQIGNAVPPLLAAAVANSIALLFSEKDVSHGRFIQPSEAKPNYVAHRTEEQSARANGKIISPSTRIPVSPTRKRLTRKT